MADLTVGGAALGGERIGTVTLVTDAVGRIRARALPLAAVFVASGAAYSAVQLNAARFGVDISGLQLNGPQLVYLAVLAVVGVASDVACLRLFLGRPLRPDAAMLRGSGLLLALALGFSLASAVWTPAITSLTDPSAQVAWGVATLIAWAVAVYALVKLTLWPIGLLDGRAEVTPARSWRLMRKATRGLILADVVLLVPIAVVMMVAVAASGQSLMAQGAPTTAYLVAGAFASTAWHVVSTAVEASVYARRVTAPSSLADVFA